jgi:hypothetical protein
VLRYSPPDAVNTSGGLRPRVKPAVKPAPMDFVFPVVEMLPSQAIFVPKGTCRRNLETADQLLFAIADLLPISRQGNPNV